MMKEETLSVLGTTIRKLREAQGLSLDELARKCGYSSANSRSTIQKIEAGKRDVPASKLKAIAEALGTTPGGLIGMTSEEQYIDLSNDEKRLLAYFHALSASGQTEALTRLQEMTSLEKYTKK